MKTQEKKKVNTKTTKKPAAKKIAPETKPKKIYPFVVRNSDKNCIEKPEVFDEMGEAWEYALGIESTHITRGDNVIMRPSAFNLSGIKRRKPETETPAQKQARLYAKRIENEKHAIVEAIEKNIFGTSTYEKLRTATVDSEEDEVIVSIKVNVNLASKIIEADASGSIKIKSKAKSSFEDPTQQQLTFFAK